jgi:Domain of unknown function (DUF4279)
MKSERTFATFRVAGDKLDPGSLTKLLGIDPTVAYAKGERYRLGAHGGAHGGEHTGRTGVWCLDTDAAIPSDRPSDHIEWLLGKLKPKQSTLNAFIDQNALHAVMTCFWHGSSGSVPPVIPKAVRDRVDAIPAMLELDFDTDQELPLASAASRK